MNKQYHSESFVIEVYVVLKGFHEIFVGFSIGVNFICGSRDDYGNLQAHILAHSVHHCLLQKPMTR
jgi:hypothetical protein